MDIVIKKSNIQGSTFIPCSKSIAHRVFICASLCKNQESVIYNYQENDDLKNTLDALKILGANIIYFKDRVIIKGIDYNYSNNAHVDIDYSASTLRFLMPIFGYFFDKTIFNVSDELFLRPLDVYEQIFDKNFHKTNHQIAIDKINYSSLYEIDNLKSSQFITGLLFILPLLSFDSKIIIKNKIESFSYIEMTIKVLKEYGINIDYKDNTFFIKGKQKYIAKDYILESDYSSLSYIAPLCLKNEITLNNIKKDSIQGDRVILDILKNIGINLQFDGNNLILKNDTLKPFEIDVSECIDLAPILIVLGIYINKPCKLLNTSRLKYKESNRGLVLKEELNKLNIDIELNNDNIVLKGDYEIKNTNNVIINPHNDHRIFMAFAILALLFDIELTIKDVECVNKSFKTFLSCLKDLNVKFILI